MEEHIKDMPTDGPLGLFFESAAHGLSQNPFLDLDEKKENLEWFRQYFQTYEEDLLNLDAVKPGQLDTGKYLYKIYKKIIKWRNIYYTLQ